MLHPRSNCFKQLLYNGFHVVDDVIHLTITDAVAFSKCQKYDLAIRLCARHLHVITIEVAIAVVLQFYTCFFQTLKQFSVKLNNFCTCHSRTFRIYLYIYNLLPSCVNKKTTTIAE